MSDAFAEYLPHAIAAAAGFYLLARYTRAWRIKRAGKGPACGGGCPSCEASQPTPSADRFHGDDDADAPRPAPTPAASTAVSLRVDRRRTG